MNIYQKLIEVRKAIPYLQKENKGNQYEYVGSSQVLGAIRDELDKQTLLLIPKIVDKRILTETVESKDKYGNQKKKTTYFTELDLEFIWVNAENPEETLTVPFYAQGVDIAGEKGVGKALTYAEKYFLLKQFNIPTDKDDPDAFQQKVEATKPPEMITQEQKDEIQSLAQHYIELRGQGDVKTVITALDIKDINKINKGQADHCIYLLKRWVAKAEKELA
ncbi:single-stranded DNA-binding protein [Bacillus sp. WMMC1349]|uniref:ERF family protein n=1 Tax=Bacillus sp. WMMC1349 TaxID=2736254 RepID=UPI001552F5B4|nr:ERF family protein [Bacillus sp. WMMC1349]NPC90992.1 single-stranded DNA-binding protein [Bacillus sp. WMMC1349]NPC91037.1 single-stranded DNA-binding protein [Bacillus sp. WMMC1349]NPC94976.1 single-stranded DNA-binding protein [Bacillus sp. WMMC1349]NPC95036.1 single-stranded DNA-binding protein [Bacillus sp. WMMC1349]NPC95070.1 single-stranded DNA-binding protein [Bacillus sp. WMMC1349]